MGKGTKKKGAIDPKVKKKRLVNKPIIGKSRRETEKGSERETERAVHSKEGLSKDACQYNNKDRIQETVPSTRNGRCPRRLRPSLLCDRGVYAGIDTLAAVIRFWDCPA